ncbi:MAG: hypothetical protein QOH33_2058, partial [Paraburkholderia sp.]|nr:hypothetical protein [Paraburkholderia sp.]
MQVAERMIFGGIVFGVLCPPIAGFCLATV